ncbi:hypothetical protein RJ639_030974 [Escallonia herrerae]|uniref:Uncharacterized protein n=1 Tax=Escallonia herrerae TaxID=1293975 RepID=A0AA88X446_9ASTE|nr:hypothetical protein RJ639_030974 [Escallonia herrerae]
MAFVTLKDMGSDFHRLERFDVGDFVRWQRKMHFLLVTVKVYYVIVNPRPPEPGENEEESIAKTRERLRWDQDDEICRGHILNGMSNTLFDAYHTVKTAKELWNQLERRYITEDATSKRFIVSKFFDYKMVDGRSVMEQFNEIKSILDRYSQHKLALDEFIVVTSIIDKLPPSWKNFRNDLKHRKEDINLDELGRDKYKLKESVLQRASKPILFSHKAISYPTILDLVTCSTRVSNELGAGNPQAARVAVCAVMFLAVIETVIVSVTIYCCRYILGHAYSNEMAVLDYISEMTPLICLSIVTDSLQAVISGIASGSGWLHIGAYVNLGAFYLLGIPVAVVLGFVLLLNAKGFWIGIVVGSTVQSIILSLVTACVDWQEQATKAKERICGGRNEVENVQH